MERFLLREIGWRPVLTRRLALPKTIMELANPVGDIAFAKKIFGGCPGTLAIGSLILAELFATAREK